jgi:hypothetical protein
MIVGTGGIMPLNIGVVTFEIPPQKVCVNKIIIPQFSEIEFCMLKFRYSWWYNNFFHIMK